LSTTPTTGSTYEKATARQVNTAIYGALSEGLVMNSNSFEEHELNEETGSYCKLKL